MQRAGGGFKEPPRNFGAGEKAITYHRAAFGAIGGYYGGEWSLGRVGAYTLAGGGIAEVTGNNFAEGAFFALATSSARFLYNKIVNYDVTWEGGEGVAPKGRFGPPVEGKINIGQQGTNNWLSEGKPFSRFLNRIPGLNATAGLHDIFQITLDQRGRGAGPFLREFFNFPGMAPAAALSYGGLMTTPVASTVFVSHRYHER